MYNINHWIPAFAGMTAGAIGVFMSDINDAVARIPDAYFR